ncbi:DUF3179 domain-containing protein [Candidatus Woesearchaeota archaeon]|nr:DUF3179 domain-containing protein [Candidatus Woesearchaeota archaeon]
MKGFAAIGIVAALMAVILASGCQKSPSEAQGKIAKTLAAFQEGSGEINSKAPQFSLTATDGTTVSIGSYSGKPAYINFFTTWCPICGEEQPDLNKAATEVKDVQFIGVSIREDLETVSKYAKRHNISYVVAVDTDGSVSKKYFTIGQPVHFFIDSEGIIRNRITGPVNYELLTSELSKLTGSTRDIKEAEKDEAKVTNGVKHTIPLDEIVEVLPQDRIPAIDSPKFITAPEAENWLNNDEIVLGLYLDGEARAYPEQIMTWHEIVNDEVRGKPLAITFCPLCDTGIAFERRINGETVTFGTSGKLYNNNLLMYDRKTKTLWNQLTGKGAVGELAGQKLAVVPIETTTWARWKKLYPETKVLSRDTGHARPYGTDPYGGYKDSEGTLFPVAVKDERLFAKARIQGIELNGKYKAYNEESILTVGLLNDNFEGRELLVIADPETAAVKLFDRSIGTKVMRFNLSSGKLLDQTGGEWQVSGSSLKAVSGELKNAEIQQLPSIGAFWFSWAAQHPETELWKTEP